MTPTQTLNALRSISRHQIDNTVHPLTCGVNSSGHQNLYPVPHLQGKGQWTITLHCADCDYVQDYIPEMFLTG